MSSSDPKSTPPPKPAHGGYQTNGAGIYGYAAVGQGAGSINGTITIPANQLQAGVNSVSLTAGGLFGSPRLPVMVFESSQGQIGVYFSEDEGSATTRAQFEPESGISAIETLKIQLLFSAAQAGLQPQIKPVSYIRTNNLERHFRFSTV